MSNEHYYPTLQLIQKLNESSQPTFLLPTKFISREAALVGELFSLISNERSELEGDYKTFFSSSVYEAFEGVIKIFRSHHNSKKSLPIHVYDSRQVLQKFIAPQHKGSECLIPGLVFTKDPKNLEMPISNGSTRGVITLLHTQTELSTANRLLNLCKEANILCCIGFSKKLEEVMQNKAINFAHRPDVFLYSDYYTDGQIPFGAFSMTNECYQPWENFQNCLLHSSTYSGNRLALSYILEKFNSTSLKVKLSSPNSREDELELYEKFVNPYASIIYKSFNLAPDIKNAKGAWLKVRQTNAPDITWLDCLGSSGCSLRGHNPDDISDMVVKSHSDSIDYINLLEKKLEEITNLSHLFCATSGSIAVEIALQLALLASPKKTILTFNNNFSGKTLGAIAVDGEQEFRAPFEPIYKHVCYFDPFQENAAENLEEVVTTSQVGIVWLELLQGGTLDEIPEALIDKIKRLQQSSNLIVGIDEVLTGSYRTGPFLLAEWFNLKPDIIALSKGLSDMTYPFSCTLLCKNAYEMSLKNNRKIVDHYSTLFSSQLGAHIALNAISQVEHLEGRFMNHADQIKQKLNQSIQNNRYISGIIGRGYLLYAKPNSHNPFVRLLGENNFTFLLSSYLTSKYRIFLLSCRITPRLNLSNSETQFLIEHLSAGINSLSFRSFSLFFFGSLLKVIANISRYTIRRWLNHIKNYSTFFKIRWSTPAQAPVEGE